MRNPADEFISTRESLLSRLRAWDDHESWREFFDTYGKLIYGLARRSGLSDDEAQDAIQETLIAVAKEMPGFRYDPALGSFKSWLREVARRRIANQFRKRPEAKRNSITLSRPALAKHPTGRNGPDDPRTATVERIADPRGDALDKIWDEEWQKNLLDIALTLVKRRVTPRQYQMFDLYVTQGWPMATVSKALGVNAAQVYMAKMRISRLIKKKNPGTGEKANMIVLPT